MKFSTECAWANPHTGAAAQYLHELCPGHFIDVWTGAEWDCECECHKA